MANNQVQIQSTFAGVTDLREYVKTVLECCSTLPSTQTEEEYYLSKVDVDQLSNETLNNVLKVLNRSRGQALWRQDKVRFLFLVTQLAVFIK